MAREGGRACGCDPKANHICEGHRKHVDTMEVEFPGVRGGNIVVSGPEMDGTFTIATNAGAPGTSRFAHFHRFVIEGIIKELQRRL